MTVEPIAKRKSTSESSAPHVYQAIADVMGHLATEGIGKNNKNTQQNFKFRGIDDVYNALARTLADNKLCVLPRITSRELTERQTKSGGVLFSVVVTAEFDFVSAIDGSKHTVGPFPGEAMDSGDKATNKAMSAAYKYMAIETFCIPTEGDNDADATTHEVAPSPPKPKAKVINPATGREIDPNNARNSRDKWTRFCERVRAFADLDELESWWADASTQAAIDQMPWAAEAAEEYEKAQERLMSAGRL